jgi:hypothetical protein
MLARGFRHSVLLPLLVAQGACHSELGPNDVADVSVSPASTTVTVGHAVQLTATALSSDGRVLTDRATTWNSVNPDVATVDDGGLVSAGSTGTVLIRATVEGKSGEATVTVTNGPVTGGPTLRIVSGDGQQATVTDTMAASLVVQVLNEDGAPLPGVMVTFLAATDTADLTSNFVTSDANGLASTVVVLKTHAGPFAVTVTVEGGSASAAFGLRAMADVPVIAFTAQGDGQSGYVGRPLPNPIVVELRDRFSNRVPGQSVGWVVTAGGGAPASATTSSDDSGQASVSWVMGSSPGPNTIEARVAGLPPTTFSALAVALGLGTITFTRGEGPPGSVLMTMKPDGTDLHTLPGSVPGDFDADWSQDGSRLVFANFAANPTRISGFNNFADVVVMNADGTGRTRLTDHFGSVSGPVWSPNRSKIAFASDQTGQSEIYVMNADGSNVVQLTTIGGYAPSWSPDGSRIAVGVKITGSFEDPKAFVMDAADGQHVVPLIAGEDPAWSPDGAVIALAVCGSSCDPDDFQLALVHPDGTGLTTVTTFSGVHQPAWSRDGSRIAFRLITLSQKQSQIWTFNPDGTGWVFLTSPADHLPTWGP